jgi:cytochrome c oxidase cbb3-type subunit 3
MKRHFKNKLFTLMILLSATMVNAQDGGQLFKAKCNTCHIVDKNSTGPILKGAKQKWTDAGEAEMLYEWVKNSQNLIATGKSKVAMEVQNFSASAMTPQAVTNEEIDAILNYVDTYTPPAPVVGDSTTVGALSPTIVPNYKENLTLFYWLLASIIVLLLGIIVMSSSINTLIRSDYFKKKLAENEEKGKAILPTIIALVGVFTLFSVNDVHAFSYMGPGEAEEGMPWLKVENSDLYAMIVVDLILISVLLYLRRMFKDFLVMARPEKAKTTVEEVAPALKKLNKILTDVVPIEEEQTILMNHEYDGIRELDNNLPPWWVWGFYATIIFAVVYIFNYHILGTADLQAQEYNRSVAEAKKEVDAYLSKMAMNVDETSATVMTEKSDLSAGKTLFEINCIACHNPKGEGNIGPNLTDDFWIYSPDVKDIFKLVKLGNANGMPEHASKLNPIQIQQVASFVLSLPYTKGKEPQGKEFKK